MRTIGIIGPADSTAKILAEAEILNLKVNFIPFIYNEMTEAPALITLNSDRVHGWLFSGPTPYAMVVDQLGPSDLYAYCSFSGAGLYKCFLQIAQEQKVILENLSLDIPHSENLHESILELGIPLTNCSISSFGSDVNTDELVRFHTDLWQAGKTKGAITSIGSVYRELQQAGLPAYRNTITGVAIRSALKLISEKATASYFKDAQVSFQLIEIEKLDAIADRTLSPYELLDLELLIKRDLIRICKKLNGYLIEKGRGRYEIFSSRGAISREVDALRNTVHKIAHEINSEVAVGIGYGDSVVAAELNARKALASAKQRTYERLVIIQDDGVLVENTFSNQTISYESQSTDEKLLSKLHHANISIKTYRKIQSTIFNMGWHSFTAGQVAHELSATERHIRRILSALADIGLVINVGESAATTRGRPSKLYQLP